MTAESTEIITGDMIDDTKIPVCYQFKIELIRASGFNENDSKLIGIYTEAFPYYYRYFGGNYVAS